MKTSNAGNDNFLDTKAREDTKKAVREVFDTVGTSETHRYSAISGGPDSMVATWLLVTYCLEKNIPVSQCTLLYFDHKQRQENNDVRAIKKAFPDITVVCGTFEEKKASEAVLRKARRNFFEKIAGANTKKPCLITGHTLTDRVETTFLNLLRGCHYKGFVNMRRVERKIARAGGVEYTVIRPLLSHTKDTIETVATQLGLPYVIDETNSDSTISKRNHLRNTVFPLLFATGSRGSDQRFFNSLQEVYTLLEKGDGQKEKEIMMLHPSKYRETTLYFCCSGSWTMTTTESLLKQVLPKKHRSKAFLEEMTYFFSSAASSRKRVKGVFFFKSHSLVYGIHHEDTVFRKQYLADYQEITTLQTYSIGDFNRSVDSQSRLGGRMRFPQAGDVYKKKPLSKWFISQKIPVFRRRYIPVIEKDGSIVAIYPFTQHEGYMYCSTS